MSSNREPRRVDSVPGEERERERECSTDDRQHSFVLFRFCSYPISVGIGEKS